MYTNVSIQIFTISCPFIGDISNLPNSTTVNAIEEESFLLTYQTLQIPRSRIAQICAVRVGNDSVQNAAW